jgi:hypothetical protein
MANYVKIFIDGNLKDITPYIYLDNVKLTTGSNKITFIQGIENTDLTILNSDTESDYIIKSILNRTSHIQVYINLDFLSPNELKMYIPKNMSSNFVKYNFKSNELNITVVDITYFLNDTSLSYKFNNPKIGDKNYITEDTYFQRNKLGRDNVVQYYSTIINYDAISTNLLYDNIELLDNGMYINDSTHEKYITKPSRNLFECVEYISNEILDAQGISDNLLIENKDISIDLSDMIDFDFDSVLNKEQAFDTSFLACDVLSQRFLYDGDRTGVTRDTYDTFIDIVDYKPTQSQFDEAIVDVPAGTDHIGDILLAVSKGDPNDEDWNEVYRYIHVIQITGLGMYDMAGTIDINDINGDAYVRIKSLPSFQVTYDPSALNSKSSCIMFSVETSGGDEYAYAAKLDYGSISGTSASGYQWVLYARTDKDWGSYTIGQTFDYDGYFEITKINNSNYFLNWLVDMSLTDQIYANRSDISIYTYGGKETVTMYKKGTSSGAIDIDRYLINTKISRFTDRYILNTKSGVGLKSFLSSLLQVTGLRASFNGNNIILTSLFDSDEIELTVLTELKQLDSKLGVINFGFDDPYNVIQSKVLDYYTERFNNARTYELTIPNNNDTIDIGDSVVYNNTKYGTIIKTERTRDLIKITTQKEYITRNLPIHHYKLQEEEETVVYDYGFKANNLTNTNVTIGQEGKIRNCYYFEGSAGIKLQSNEIEEWETSNLSFSFWIKGGAESVSNNALFLNGTFGVNPYMCIRMSSSDLIFQGDTGSLYGITHYVDLSESQGWFNFVITLDNINQIWKIYKNGVLVETETGKSVDLSAISDYLKFGELISSNTNAYLEDFRIYNYVLNLNEAESIYNNGAGTLN